MLSSSKSSSWSALQKQRTQPLVKGLLISLPANIVSKCFDCHGVGVEIETAKCGIHNLIGWSGRREIDVIPPQVNPVAEVKVFAIDFDMPNLDFSSSLEVPLITIAKSLFSSQNLASLNDGIKESLDNSIILIGIIETAISIVLAPRVFTGGAY